MFVWRSRPRDSVEKKVVFGSALRKMENAHWKPWKSLLVVLFGLPNKTNTELRIQGCRLYKGSHADASQRDPGLV